MGGLVGPLRYILSLLALVGLCIFIFLRFLTISRVADQVKTVAFDPTSTLAYQVASTEDKSYSDLAILLLAGLWTFCVVKRDDRIRGRDWPEWIVFLSATIAFALVFYFKYRHDTVLERASWRAAQLKMNVDPILSPYLDAYRSGEIAAFFLALALSALTIISAVYVRPSNKE